MTGNVGGKRLTAELDVREGSANSRERRVDTSGACACAASIEPRHAVSRRVIPQRHSQDHAGVEGLGEGSEAAQGCEASLATRGAEGRRNRVSANGRRRILDNDTILDVYATNLLEVATRSARVSNELGDDGERLGGINSLARAVETVCALPIGVETAPIAVALARATRARALVRTILQAAVRSESVGDRICLPDVHLSAAEPDVVNIGLQTM